MFGIFASPDRKMRANAVQWLELADKVHHYRRDQITAAELADLETNTQELRRLVRDRAERMKVKIAVDSLEGVLRQLGGHHYPKSSLVENVEFFLVAAIVILGFRAFFIQPFKIPTNSMWPSYNGMTPEVFTHVEDEPGFIMRGARLLLFGATQVRVDANNDGDVLIPLLGNAESAIVPYENVPGRNWLVFPATKKKYALIVGGKPVTMIVPADFDFEWAIRDAYFPEKYSDHKTANADLAELLNAQKEILRDNSGRMRFLRAGKTVKKGERVLAFDVMTGDQLFVDRMTYHFISPKVGQGFVFRTGKIDNKYMKDRSTGRQIDQYYIKRLVGTPGDTLEIKDFTLFRNGVPITGSTAFDKNSRRSDNYVGYRNELSLSAGKTMTVPSDHYLALGDNSANSQDGRYWGYVPASEVIGRPIFIYYPFSMRWGPVR